MEEIKETTEESSIAGSGTRRKKRRRKRMRSDTHPREEAYSSSSDEREREKEWEKESNQAVQESLAKGEHVLPLQVRSVSDLFVWRDVNKGWLQLLVHKC